MEKNLNVEIPYITIYRDIKYPRIEFKTGRLVLVLPKDFKEEKAFITFIQKHLPWIYRKNREIQSALQMADQRKLVMNRDNKQLRNMVHTTVKRFTKELNTSVNKVFYRTMKTKWGSCSPNKNLTINTLLRYLPKNLIEYILYHELIHTIERKHTERFWRILEKKFKDHQKYERELLAYWFLIQKECIKSDSAGK